MATTNLGRVAIVPQGIYSAAVEYKKLDLVNWLGGSYMYINSTPAAGVPLTDTTHWQQIAAQGDPTSTTPKDLTLADAGNHFPIKNVEAALQTAGGRLSDISKKLPENVINIKEYGAVCDGVTDDSAAIQAAINAAEGSTTILIGNCRLHSALVVDKFIKFKGYAFVNANDTGASATSRLYFDTALAVAISSAGGSLSFEDIIVSGVSQNGEAGIGIGVTDCTVSLTNAIIQGFYCGISVLRGYYCKLQESSITYCRTAANFDNCYNINFVNMSINADVYGVTLKNGSNLNCFGGTVESFSASGIFAESLSRAHLFGVYFEGAAGGGVYAVQLSGVCSVEAIGCHAYLTTMYGFLYAEDEGQRVYSRHNFFVYPTDASAVLVYSLNITRTAVNIDISGDNWDAAAGANVTYCPTAITSNGSIFEISYPVNHPNAKKSISTKPNTQKLTRSTPTVETGTIVNFGNAGFAGDDPLGLSATAWGYLPYRAIYQKSQWEKVGARLPNQADSTAADVATIKTDFNALLGLLRANGIML